MDSEPIIIISDKCTGCSLCVEACPFDAIAIEDKLAVVDLDKCNLCGACVDACKVEAVVIRKQVGPKADLSAFKDVWIFAEQKDGNIQSITFELLGE